MTRMLVSLALLSCALVAFQLVLMQSLSIVQWYHFAYMVISVALLGFGASGTLLSLARDRFLKRAEVLVPLLMIASGMTMMLSLPLSQYNFIRFDSYLLFVEGKQVLRLVFTYLLFFFPFVLGALAIALLFLQHTIVIGRVYAANLVGSAAGGGVALGLMWLVPVHHMPVVIGFMAISAGVLLITQTHRRSLLAVAAVGGLLALVFVLLPSPLHPSEYKSLSRTLTLPEARVKYERSSPYGLVHVVSSPALRYAPGLSLSFKGTVPSEKVVFNNGDWFGPIVGYRSDDSLHVADYSTFALPYVLDQRRRVLVLQARTGLFAAQALLRGAEHVTVVEPHREVLELLRHEFAQESDSLLFHPAINVHALEPRSFLKADTSRFDLLVLPTLDAFGGTSGVYALQEQYLLTREAFREMWDRLTPNGVLTITSWMDQPARNPLRALATITDMLADAGVVSPKMHIAAIRSWGTVTFAVKRSPVTQEESNRVLDFCRRMQFDPLLLPDLTNDDRNTHNVLYDPAFFGLVDGLVGPQRKAVIASYAFRINAPTDNQPYFSQFLRWSNIPQLYDSFGQHALPFVELGSFLIALTLVQILVLAIVLILLPLAKKKIAGDGSASLLLYFAAIGLGYMFVEMVLIQRFVLYLGQPLYAAAAAIGAMLMFSGAGSARSSRFTSQASLVRRKALVIAILVLAYAAFLDSAIHHTITLPLPWRFLLAGLMVAPLAFMMGMPFPLGVRVFGDIHPNAVAWGWGINCCASVIAAPLATLIAIEAGFALVLVIAAGLYLAAALSTILLANRM